MSKFGDLQKKLDEDDAKFREEQEARNHKQMKELAEIHPTPTIEELRKILEPQAAQAAPIKKPEPKKVEAELEGKPEKTGYQTRESTSKK